MTAEFVVEREMMHHVMQTYLPSALIVVISWLVPFIYKIWNVSNSFRSSTEFNNKLDKLILLLLKLLVQGKSWKFDFKFRTNTWLLSF